MTPCVTGSNGLCENCGRAPQGTCPAINRFSSRAGLGDMVKAGLSAIGITEERVSAVIGRPCGCSGRAEKLNELGRKIGIG